MGGHNLGNNHMNKISTFTYKDKSIDVLYQNGNIAYAFEHDGNHYGNKVKLEDRSIITIASTVWVLLQNAIETIEAVQKNDNTGV